MAQKPRSPEILRQWKKTLLDSGNNIAATARTLGIPRQTLQAAIDAINAVADDDTDIRLPEFPDDDIPTEEIINGLAKRFRKRKASFAAHTWFPISVKDNKPIGILWFGDPHVDDNGCDWDTLRAHVAICNDTPGVWGANIGDTTNNWSGRLVKLYANQDTSVATARKLAKWLMLDCGVRWLIWLIGNHDAWGDGAEILAQMGARHGTQQVVCHDWEARFRLVFPNGWEPRIFAAHNFAGHSMWNPLHGPLKAGLMGAEADLYVCGHLHNWAEFGFENSARGREQHFIRVRGYKYMDEYARHLGKFEQESGAGILTIFNPAAKAIYRFVDVAAGARFLTMLRAE